MKAKIMEWVLVGGGCEDDSSAKGELVIVYLYLHICICIFVFVYLYCVFANHVVVGWRRLQGRFLRKRRIRMGKGSRRPCTRLLGSPLLLFVPDFLVHFAFSREGVFFFTSCYTLQEERCWRHSLYSEAESPESE